MTDEILETITIADLPNDDLRWIAQDCGIAVARTLLKKFGYGMSIYVPYFHPDDWSKVTYADLPKGDMRLVADQCGVDIAIALMQSCGGAARYIPRLETSQWVRKYIRVNYSGSNARFLAAALGVSERFIYKCTATAHAQARRQKPESDIVIIGGVKCQKLDLFNQVSS